MNPILLKGIPYLTGGKTYEESLTRMEIDIEKAPSVDRPLLIFHSGKDRLIRHPKEHADRFMRWAKGEKELKYYPDGEHFAPTTSTKCSRTRSTGSGSTSRSNRCGGVSKMWYITERPARTLLARRSRPRI